MNNEQTPSAGEQAPRGELAERSTAHLTLRYRSGSFTSQQIEQLAARAERVARYVDGRLARIRGRYAPVERVALQLSSEPAPLDDERMVVVRSDAAGGELEERVALALVRQRFGPPEFWQAPASQADAVAIANALDFLATGLARYFATQAQQQHGQPLFASRAGGGAPRQSADQVVRQCAADRDGKVPVYECLLRGPSLASSPPEYAALAESFCGYLFEREGAKAYRRFCKDCRDNPNAAADLVYGKTLEQLVEEWLRAILRGQGRRPVSLKSFGRQILPYLRPYTWLVILALLLMLLSAGVAQVAPFAIRDIIDIIGAAVGKADRAFFGELLGMLTGQGPAPAAFSARHELALSTLGRLYSKIAILALAVFVNICALTWLVYVVNVVGQNILRDLRLQFTSRLHHLSAGFYSRHRMGDMLARFTSDIARMADPLTEAVAYSVYYLIFVVATAISMLAMSWQLSLVLLLIIPTYLAINRKFGPTIQVASRARQERLAQLNANLEEMLFGHSLVKAYGLGGSLMSRFRPKITEYRKVAIWADFLRAIYKEVIGIAENLQTKLVLLVGGSLAIFGFITTGTIVGFNALAGRFINPLHNLGLIYAGVSVASASLRRVEEILREPMEVMDTPSGGTYAPDGVHEAVTFEGVYFTYTGANPTLVDINLRIPAGSKFAFVGPTGAGKSTLVNLIPRFYDVDRGSIRIDGRDIRSFSLAGLRRGISIVSQDTFIFNSTILENIRLGRLDASDDEVVDAARGARLHNFITSLPAGYDTLVGERGSRLSGGQKQRVAIARALLRNSPILILDEATSALDAETESQILAELDEVTVGKTVISITHRLGLAIKSDTICVLQDGRIVQQGSHEELIGQPGLYRKLFEDQNRDLLERSANEQPEPTRRERSAPSFSVVSEAEVERVSGQRPPVRCPAGEALCTPNGAGQRLYLLRSGQVELSVPDESGAAQRLKVGAPDGGNGSGGGLYLLMSLPGSVGALALTDSEVQLLESDELRSFLWSAWDGPPAAPGSNGDLAGHRAPLGA